MLTDAELNDLTEEVQRTKESPDRTEYDNAIRRLWSALRDRILSRIENTTEGETE